MKVAQPGWCWRAKHSPWFVVAGSDRLLWSRNRKTQYFPPEHIVEWDTTQVRSELRRCGGSWAEPSNEESRSCHESSRLSKLRRSLGSTCTSCLVTGCFLSPSPSLSLFLSHTRSLSLKRASIYVKAGRRTAKLTVAHKQPATRISSGSICFKRLKAQKTGRWVQTSHQQAAPCLFVC